MILAIGFENNTESIKKLNKFLLNEYTNLLNISDDKSKHFINSEISKLKKYETYVTQNIHYYRVNGYIIYANHNFLNFLYPINVYDVTVMDLIYNNVHLINYKEFQDNLLQDFIKHIQQLT